MGRFQWLGPPKLLDKGRGDSGQGRHHVSVPRVSLPEPVREADGVAGKKPGHIVLNVRGLLQGVGHVSPAGVVLQVVDGGLLSVKLLPGGGEEEASVEVARIPQSLGGSHLFQNCIW